MNKREWVRLALAAMLFGRCALGQASFSAAYVRSGDHGGEELALYPTDGPGLIVPLPGIRVSRVVAFSPEGRAIYAQNRSGLTKIEFDPTRETVEPGATGLGTIWSLAVSQRTGRLIATAGRQVDGKAECGVYEIDPVGGALRALWRGAYPDCGGPVSPTSGCMLRSNAKQLDLVNLESGSVETLFRGRGGPTPIPAGVWSPNAVWSPDGRWISAIQDGRLVVIDANNTSKRRKLGRSDHPGVWSPDSKYLLFIKSQFSCLATLYFESLEVLEVESGKRTMIKSAHCNVGGGMAVGWIDRSVIH